MPKKPSKSVQETPAPSVNQVTENETLENPRLITGILKAIEVLEARIRYNAALLAFLQDSTNDKIVQFADKFIAPKLVLTTFMNPDVAQELRNELDSLNATKIRAELIEGTTNDIDSLKKILRYFKNALTDKSEILHAIMHIQIAITIEENSNNTAAAAYNDLIKNFTDSIAKLRKEINNFPQRTHVSTRIIELESQLKIITKAKLDFFKTNPDKNETPGLQQVLDILDKFEVTDKLEREFLTKYAKIELIDGNIVCAQTTEYTRLEVRNHELVQKMLKDMERKFGDLYVNEALYARIKGNSDNLISHIMPRGANITQLITCYKYQHGFAQALKIFQKEIEEEVTEERKWLDEQQKILAYEKLAEQQLIAEISAAKAAEKSRLEVEQKAQAQRDKIADIERKAQHKLDLQQQRDERARVKTEKEQQRILRKRQQVIEKVQIESRDDNQQLVKSKYIVPINLVAENREVLQNLFDHRTKAFRYRDAETLIRNLGGRIDKSTGSSHQCVIFNETLYQQVDFEPEVDSPRATSVKSSIARPHAGETELRHFNLELFRESIRCVLPDGWDLEPVASRSAGKPRSP